VEKAITMHQKHPKIARPPQRTFGRTAFSLVGTSCARIEALMADWLKVAAQEFHAVGVTGDHQEVRWAAQGQHGSRQWMSTQGDWNEYDDRLQARVYDLALVNGNHYPAERQIVFLDPAKAGTLERRREQLTDIAAIVRCGPEVAMPAWLEEDLTKAATPFPPIVALDRTNEVLQQIVLPLARQRNVPLKALILAGGKSSRMGENKAELVYHGQETELNRLTRCCQEAGLEVFHSVQTASEAATTTQIEDRFLGLGPAGAIASAFLHDPESAWLVLACDLPLLQKEDLLALIHHRDARQYATAIQGASRPFPEPLIAIYEPRAYSRLLRFLTLGYACPRKLLINSNIATLIVKNEELLSNANTPEERALILQKIVARG
jgi:molybdopterin-guanine dinucleotide biosynthesis protein A